VRIEYGHTGGPAWFSFRWVRPGETLDEVVPAAALFRDQAAAAAARGSAPPRSPPLTFQFYRDRRRMTQPDGEVRLPQDFFLLPQTAQRLGLPDGPVAVQWRGRLRVPREGRWLLAAVADDGVRLWVGGRLVLDRWRVGRPVRYEVELALPAGLHQVRLDYFRDRGDGRLSLRWRPPGGHEQVVPAEALVPQ
jgi:hypothetical protein